MKKNILFFILMITFLVTQFGSNTGKNQFTSTKIPFDFEYDGCSMFPDGNYRDCCIIHDTSYFVGGTWQDRLSADNKLYSCVSGKGGGEYSILAGCMWIGVRFGGAPIFPTSYRWGFGRDRNTKNPAQ